MSDVKKLVDELREDQLPRDEWPLRKKAANELERLQTRVDALLETIRLCRQVGSQDIWDITEQALAEDDRRRSQAEKED